MNIETLREQFDELGVNASEDVLVKCLEICFSHDLDDAEEFVEKWMAYSISNLGGADPSIEFLIQMENRELSNVKGKQTKNLKRSSEKPTKLKVYKQGNELYDEVDEEESALLGSYVCLTPKNDRKAVSRIQKNTPDITKKATFSPVSYSPLATKKSRIESVKAGNVVVSFGNYAAASAAITQSRKPTVSICIDASKWIDEKAKYMTTSMVDDGQFVTERIFSVSAEISRKILADQNKNDNDDQLALNHCDELSQENVQCMGKIFSCSRTNKLDQKSAIFIGFDENKMRPVQLDLARLKPSASIFPGEICVVAGNNPRGKSFAVTEIHSEILLTQCQLPLNLSDPMSFVIASAPFTIDENLLFEPLEKLIENCQNTKPNVVILTGSFFESSSKLIFDLATEVDEHFKKMLTDISERLGEDTKIVVVASVDDINGAACYPTRPYSFKRGGLPSNVFLAPDPCMLDINGIKIAVTSVDIAQHLADSEFCINAGGDKIRRYMNCLFHQKSFYPLFPPKMPTDIRLMHEYAALDKIPHILVVPSDLKYYMRDFNNCLCINPGRLSPTEKSAIPEGSFARLIVQTPPKDVKNSNAWISGQVVYL